MTIRDRIIKDLKESFFPKFSDIAKKNETSRGYVIDIYNQIPKEIKTKEEEIDDAEDYAYVEPEYKEIKLLPKINKLADGRTELIYESKMNYNHETQISFDFRR